ncbi:uncharacterized protein LOC112556798 [Pomacea canaliculata]|uniref:uncharacterized protein LOC112556798 n=1 Tax=Pomacea canaliculata TaxID=400727 RepID=UPI000D7287E0|nr:uncharacterized protein LOC112556798 [Pomacea canaliculata]
MRPGASILLFLLLSFFKASLTQDLRPPSDDASFLLTALCIQDNRIRESCLHNVHTRSILNGLLLALNSQSRLDGADSGDAAQKMELPDKRRRDQDDKSGFYSNW